MQEEFYEPGLEVAYVISAHIPLAELCRVATPRENEKCCPGKKRQTGICHIF